MRLLRIVFILFYAFLSMLFFNLTCIYGVEIFKNHSISWTFLGQFIRIAILIVFAVVFGIAWWVLWRKRDSVRIWGIVASIINLFISVGVPIFFCRVEGMGAFWMLECVFGLPTLIGVIGLVMFLGGWPRSD
jgi:hypothetical protein